MVGRHFFRIGFSIFLAIVLFFGLGIAALKYWLLPNIHFWKEPIAETLTQALGTPVRIGHIKVKWQGFKPEIELNHVVVLNQKQEQVLNIPYAFGQMRLSSLFHWKPHFAHLEIRGLRLDVYQDTDGQFELIGQSLQWQDDGDESVVLSDALYDWLIKQGSLKISQSELVWHNAALPKRPLNLGIEFLDLSQKQGQLHALGLFTSAKHAHTRLHLDGSWQFTAGQNQEKHHHTANAESGDGHLSLRVENLQPSAWRDWVDIPSFLYQGTIHGLFQLKLQNHEVTHLQGNITVKRPFWADGKQLLTMEAQPFFQANSAHFNFELQASAIKFLSELTAEDKVPYFVPGTQWQVEINELAVHMPAELTTPLFFEKVRLHANSAPQEEHSVWQIHELLIDDGVGHLALNGQLQLDVHDLWQTQIALQGQGQDVNLNSIYQYIPNSLDSDLREWMQNGLTDGKLSYFDFIWQGVLDDFEYYQADTIEGLFELTAQLENATIDYYPEDDIERGWPPIAALNGWLFWRNDVLEVKAKNEPFLQIAPEHEVVIKHIAAKITNLYEQADLVVQAKTQGQAESYLPLWSNSNLGVLLEDSIRVEQAKGFWKIPLTLALPLGVELEEMEEAIKVQGAIEFNGNTSLKLWPELAPFHSLSGVLEFTELGVTIPEIKGLWLDGPIVLKGALGKPNEQLAVNAQPSAKALSAYYQTPWLKRVEGEASIQVILAFDANEHFTMQAKSDLFGIKIDLPYPLNKQSANTRWPVELQWQALDSQVDQNKIQLSLTDKLHLEAILDFATKRVDAFNLTTPAKPAHLTSELVYIDLAYPFLDLDNWWELYEKYIDVLDDEQWDWPPTSNVRLKAEQVEALGFNLNLFTYTHQLVQPDRWRIDISSEQIAGTAFWHTAATAQHPSGYLDAHFQRFDMLANNQDINEDNRSTKHPKEQTAIHSVQKSAVQQFSDDLVETGSLLESKAAQRVDKDFWYVSEPPLKQLPRINLVVDELRIKNYLLGSLHLKANPLADASGWGIDSWRIKAKEFMVAHGAGQWRLWGRLPVLYLNGDVQFSDLGEYSHYVGLDDLVSEGQGTLAFNFDWPYFPWRSELNQLSGDIQLSVKNGRLQPVRSRSAKLLEFLSLQSLSRIARLDVDLGSVVKEGFPFTEIQGSVKIRDGWLSTNDYQVLSPIGTLFFDGRTNIKTQQIDAQAVVIPEVDVSGAALAAGIAVNPLVGFGALVAQWILKHPLSAAMTARYRIGGNWDDFQVEDLPLLENNRSATEHE